MKNHTDWSCSQKSLYEGNCSAIIAMKIGRWETSMYTLHWFWTHFCGLPLTWTRYTWPTAPCLWTKSVGMDWSFFISDICICKVPVHMAFAQFRKKTELSPTMKSNEHSNISSKDSPTQSVDFESRVWHTRAIMIKLIAAESVYVDLPRSLMLQGFAKIGGRPYMDLYSKIWQRPNLWSTVL